MLARREGAGLASRSSLIRENSFRGRSLISSAAAAASVPPTRCQSSFSGGGGGGALLARIRAASTAFTSRAKHARQNSWDRIRGRLGSVRSLSVVTTCFSSSSGEDDTNHSNSGEVGIPSLALLRLRI